MRQIFVFEKDRDKLKLLLFHIKDNEVFIDDYRQREISSEASGSDIIKEFISSNKATVSKTICLLPLSSIYLRKLAFPYRRISQVKKSIRFAIEPHIPIPVESAKIFFQPVLTKGAGGIEAVSFIVPEMLLNEQLELMNSSGMVCDEIYLEPLSIFEFLVSRVKIKENVLWLYVADDATYVFSALKGGKLADLRQMPFGRGDLAAEKDELKREISTVLLSKMSQVPENKISQIYVSGLPAEKKQEGGSATEEKADKPEIRGWLGENFNIAAKTIELNELVSVNWASDSSKQSPAPKSSVSVPEILYAGLAPNSVLNFYPPVLQEKEKRGIKISIFLAVFILLAVSFRLQFERNIYERKFAVLDSQIEEIFTETFPDASDKRTPLLQMRAMVKSLKENSSLTDIISLSPLEALREISQNLGRDLRIELDSFRAKEDGVTISGSASSYGDIDKIKVALENSPLFSKVDIESAQTTDKGVTFRLKITPSLNK
ncbi:MAG: PilN domain-containing protein [Candidatus Ratteibacteria bacterium]|nr:PilN domain-containing protein [Candidatus Ratteibacteria bacterium]